MNFGEYKTMTTYKQKLLPWSVYRWDGLQWILMNSYRTKSQAEEYARIYRNSTGYKTEITFNLADQS